jgi:hypothetical protein
MAIINKLILRVSNSDWENDIKTPVDLSYTDKFYPIYESIDNNFIYLRYKIANDRIKNNYQVYDIESILNENSDLPGTFNYYPNIYDEFTENPKFIFGNNNWYSENSDIIYGEGEFDLVEFDELDNIINLDEDDLLNWGKLVCLSSLWNNINQSVRCLENLKNTIYVSENDSEQEYESEISNLQQQLAILQEIRSNEDNTINLDPLEKKISNLSIDIENEKDINGYMIDKLEKAILVYHHVDNIARDYCDDRDSGGEA